jgi:hypothetical protein
VDQLHEERSVAAAHIDDDLVTAPFKPCQPLDASLPPLDHCPVEGRPLVRIGRKPAPEVGPEHPCEDRLGRTGVKVADRAIPDAAEQVREVVPAVAPPKHVGGLRVAKDARLVFCEDTVARQRAQEPVQHVRIGAELRCHVVDRSWAGGERVRDLQVGRDCQRAGGQYSPEEVPDSCFG